MPLWSFRFITSAVLQHSVPAHIWAELNQMYPIECAPIAGMWGRVSSLKPKSFWFCCPGFDSLNQPAETSLWWGAGLQQGYRSRIHTVSPKLRHTTTTQRERGVKRTEGEIQRKRDKRKEVLEFQPKRLAFWALKHTLHILCTDS